MTMTPTTLADLLTLGPFLFDITNQSTMLFDIYDWYVHVYKFCVNIVSMYIYILHMYCFALHGFVYTQFARLAASITALHNSTNITAEHV